MTSLPEHRPSVVPRPPRRGGSCGVAGLVIGALVVVCALPVLGFLGWTHRGPDLDDPKAVAGRYLERIEAGDDAAAYGLVCSRTRRDVTAAAFTALVVAGPRPVSHAVIGGGFLDEPGRRAAIDVRIVDRTGATRQISLVLDSGEGAWLVCGKTLV